MSSSDPIKKITLRNGKTRYRFVLDVGRKPDGRRDQWTYTFDTKKEVRAEYARIKHETDRGTYVRSGKVTVDEFLDEWLASATRDVEEATASNYRDALLPVRARLGGKPLQDVNEAD
ncbi:hypothetical protein GCM10009541_49760 [Micromonospora gifhornensis]|uniref:Core-binding (CB) domain-containing protein n=1 Tax=Micromonospora gifhornensis TaxID=84594 RepID=A0ABQ4IKQ0_9ACTN|nr:hypothetical protein [Micromonospora gifhornensis]GIJ18484.1 hypothetical protein Vgi01_51680 [Micromonospora gifhornensis]